MSLPKRRRWARKGETVDPVSDEWHDENASLLRGHPPVVFFTGNQYLCDQGPNFGYTKPITLHLVPSEDDDDA